MQFSRENEMVPAEPATYWIKINPEINIIFTLMFMARNAYDVLVCIKLLTTNIVCDNNLFK